MYSTIFAAISTDGYIADNHGKQNWTSPEDSAFLKQTLKNYDVYIMGRKTFEAHKHKLNAPGKVRIVLTSKPKYYAKKYPNAHVHFVDTSVAGAISLYKDKNVAILGGSDVYTEALELGLCNTMFLTFEQVTLGSGVPFTHSAYKITTDFIESDSQKALPKNTKYFVKIDSSLQ